MFADREEAGRQLADELASRGVEADIILAIPRGGLPVARPVAERLGVDLEVVVARKIGAPWNPELAIGAVASDGTTWLNEAIIADGAVEQSYIDRGIETESAAAAEKLERYRGVREPPALDGRRVIIVDDGVATGATMFACVEHAKALGASSVIVAVPVGSSDSIAMLRSLADDVVCLEEPSVFSAVGQFYQTFGQVSEEEAAGYLDS